MSIKGATTCQALRKILSECYITYSYCGDGRSGYYYQNNHNTGVTSLTYLIMVLKTCQKEQFCISYSKPKSLHLVAMSKTKLVHINSGHAYI